MPKGGIIRGVAALVCAAAMAAAAFADIKAFNDAVGKGDLKAAAAAAAETWPTLDKTSSDIAVIAREFAFAAMRGGDPKGAAIYAEFLVTNGATLPTPDAMPLTSAVLHAWANYSVAVTMDNRNAFLVALERRAQHPSVDMISLIAAQQLYDHSIRSRLWEDARDAALAASIMAKRGGAATIVQTYRASLTMVAAEFMRNRQRAPYTDMRSLDKLIYEDAIRPASRDIKRDLLVLHDTAWAWHVAMGTYLTSIGEQDLGATDYELHKGSFSRYDHPGGIRYCSTQRSGGELVRINQKLLSNDAMGAVVVKFGLDASGKVLNPSIAASIPSGVFDEAVLKAVRTWRFKSNDKDPKTCQLQRDEDHFVYEFIRPTLGVKGENEFTAFIDDLNNAEFDYRNNVGSDGLTGVGEVRTPGE